LDPTEPGRQAERQDQAGQREQHHGKTGGQPERQHDPREGQEQQEERDQEGLSSLAAAYQKAGPVLGASTQLVAAVGIFSWLGYWLDQKLEHRTPWFLLLGALLGMTGGFIGFFRTVLGKRDK